jgi:hypothetical protein
MTAGIFMRLLYSDISDKFTYSQVRFGRVMVKDGYRIMGKAKIMVLSGITEVNLKYFIQINKLLPRTKSLKTTVGQTDTLPKF